jgi:hypothetical protein
MYRGTYDLKGVGIGDWVWADGDEAAVCSAVDFSPDGQVCHLEDRVIWFQSVFSGN